MWWSERTGRSGRAAFGVASALVLGLLVAACGFRPLYKPAPSEQPEPTNQLAQIRIDPLANRVGQQLHNLLRDRLNPAGTPKEPKYDLTLNLTSLTQQTGIRVDETATRANLILRATYRLYDRESEQLLVEGRSDSFSSYNILDAFYATTISEENALERGLREIADDVTLRLAIYFGDPDADKERPRLLEPDVPIDERDEIESEPEDSTTE